MRIPNVLHPVVQPIAVGEFAEALHSVCRRLGQQLPPHTPPRRQPVSVACSGGVDSMALVWLLAQLRRQRPDFILGGALLGTVNALIVDHQIRRESTQEARQVHRAISEHLGGDELVRPHRLAVAWPQLLGRAPPAQLADLPNLEQWARKARFRALAEACRALRTMRLFVAHHQDDNYETVLLRLAMGYTGAGLQGISPVADIPECHGLYSCSGSGMSDYASENPGIFPQEEMRLDSLRQLEQCLDEEPPSSEAELEPLGANLGYATATIDKGPDYGIRASSSNRRSRDAVLAPILVEDGGINVCRPLLGFPKARLMATCEAASLPWVEDPSNQDATLTPRNAIRHLCAHHTLPVALQKPAVLGMAQAIRLRHEAVAAEARRTLIRHTAVKQFSPNTGMLLVKFPVLKVAQPRRKGSRLSKEWWRLRQAHRRAVTASMVRQVIEIVTSDADPPSLSSLDPLVSVITARRRVARTPPKAFTHSHVLFTPITPSDSGPSPYRQACPTGETRWQLSRQPPVVDLSKRQGFVPFCYYPIHDTPLDDDARLLPTVQAMAAPRPTASIPAELPNFPEFPSSPWSTHNGAEQQFKLWDNRFWIRLRSRLHGIYAIAPPTPHHLQHFRAALPRHESDRLVALLRMHAPAKARYTLPALYVVWDRESTEWRPGWSEAGGGPGRDGVTLVALPSLGVELAGLYRWLQCEVRYKKVDRGLLPTVV